MFQLDEKFRQGERSMCKGNINKGLKDDCQNDKASDELKCAT